MNSRTNLYALEEAGKEKDLINWLLGLAKPYDIYDITPIDTSDVCVFHWVRLKCKYGCTKYGTSWCCPPETPDPDHMKAILKEYEKALILSGRITNGQFYRDNSSKRRVQVRTWKGIVVLERALFLAGYYKAFSLVSETCALCKECSYPRECVFPNFRRPSVESCSIDILGTLKRIGSAFQIAQDINEAYTCHSLILLE